MIAEEATRCGMPYVNERWLGGLLTNFVTIQRVLGRLRDLDAWPPTAASTCCPRRKSSLERERTPHSSQTSRVSAA